MAGVFQKVRIAVLSNVHMLLDKIIDLNSVEAIKQHLRDLEKAREELREAVAVADGNKRTLKRKGDQLAAFATQVNADIDVILTDTDPENDHLAHPLEARLAILEGQIQDNAQQLNDAVNTTNELEKAESALTERFEFMVGSIQRLEAIERTTKAKNAAADSLKQVARLAGGEVSVDDVSARLEANYDVANARFDRAMGGMAIGQEQETRMAVAASRVAERRKRLIEAGKVPAALPAGSENGAVEVNIKAKKTAKTAAAER